jgi:hypothetical protein
VSATWHANQLAPLPARNAIEGVAHDLLVSADRCLDLGPKIVPAGLLPGHAAPFGNHPQVTVALGRGGLGRGTHDRARPWRHDDRIVCMTLGNHQADPVLVVIAVGREGSTANR